MAPLGKDTRKGIQSGRFTKKMSKKKRDELTKKSPGGGSSSGGSSRNNYTGGTGGGGYGAQTRRQIDQGAPKRSSGSGSESRPGYIAPQHARNNNTAASRRGGIGADTRRGIDNGSFVRPLRQRQADNNSGALFQRRKTNNINSNTNIHQYSDWRKTQRENEKERTAHDRLMEAASRRVNESRRNADRQFRTIGEQLPGRQNYRQHNLERSFEKNLETSEAKWHGTSRKSGYYSAGGSLTGGRKYYVKDEKDNWRETSYESWKKQNDHDQKEEDKYRKLAATDERYKNDPRANWDDYGAGERIADTVSGAFSSHVRNIQYGLNDNNSVNHRAMSSVEQAQDNLKIAAARASGGEKAARAMANKLAKQREDEKKQRFKDKIEGLNEIDRKASAGEAKMQAAQHGTKGLAKFGLETLGTVTGMGVDIGIGTALGGIGAIPSMVVGAAGGSARQADKDEYGRSKTMMALRSGGVDAAEKQQEINRRYGAVSGAIEGLSEKIFAIGAPMQKLVGKGVITGDRLASKMASRLANSKSGRNLVSAITKAGMSMTGEGLEEVVSGVLNPIAEKMIVDKDKDLDWGQIMSDSLHDALIGGVVGGLFGGAEIYSQKKQGAFIRDKASEEEMIREGLRSDEGTKAHQLARDMQENIDKGKESTDFEVRDLNESLNETMTEEYKKVEAAKKQSDEELEKEFGEDAVSRQKNNKVSEEYMFRQAVRQAAEERGQETDENELDEDTINVEAVKHYENVVDNATTKMQEKLQANFIANAEEGEDISEADELPKLDKEYGEAVQAIANISVGEAELNDYALFSETDPIARETLQEVLGVDLPEGNAATRDALIKLNMENRRNTIELGLNENVIAEVRQQLGDKGHEEFTNAMKHHNVSNDNYAVAYDVFKYYYDAGVKGTEEELPYDQVPVPHIARDVIPRKFMAEAYRAGHRAGKTQQEVNEKNVRKATQKKEGRFTDSTSQKFRNSLDEKDAEHLETITDILKGLSDVWKVNIELTDPSNISNGYYKDGTIYINANISDILLDTFTHEFTHHMEKLAPKEWKAYADFVAQKMNEKKAGSFEKAINRRMELYGRSEKTKLSSRDDARREVIADSTRALFEDKNFPKELAQHDVSLARKIADILKKIIAQIKQVVKANNLREAQRQEFSALWNNLDTLQELRDRFIAAAKAQTENETSGTGGTQYEVKYTTDNTEQKKTWSLKEGRTISEEVIGAHSGQLDAKIEAREDNKLAGYIEYSVYNEKPAIKYIHTEDDFKRQGVATAMLQHLQSLYPDQEIDWGMMTPDGVKLQESSTLKIENPKVAEASKKLITEKNAIRKTEEELDRLYEKENLTSEEEQRLQELGDLWDEQHFNIYNLEKELEGKKSYKRMVKMPEENSRQFSLRERDEAYMKAVRSGNMREAQRMVDEAAKRAGWRTVHAFHGTLNYGFNVFDKSKARVEGNSGAGFYFSTNQDDSEGHYSDVEGADNVNKIQSLAYSIYEEGEWDGKDVDSYEEAEEIARSEIEKEPGTYDVYLKYEKPYIRNYRNSTNLYDVIEDNFDDSVIDRDEYDDEDDYEEALMYEREEQFYDAIYQSVYNAYSDLEDNYEIVDAPDLSDIVSQLCSVAADGSLTWDDINEVIDNSSDTLLLRDDSIDTEWGAAEFTRAIIENFGFDAIEDKEVDSKFGQLSRDMMRGTEHIIVFNPEQIKRSDPVTYDDAGKVIPLSARFNPESKDIRFALKEPVEQVRDLIAVHNLKPDDLRGALKLGGFPMPSIAVVRSNMGHNKYGDISLLFHSDTIDPAKSRYNEVYGGDAYTPTFPTIEKKISNDVLKRVADRLRKTLGIEGYGDEIKRGFRLPALDTENVRNAISYSSPYEAYRDDPAFKLAYLKEKTGKNIRIPMVEAKLYNEGEEFWKFLSSRMPKVTSNDLFNATAEEVMKYEPAIREALRDYKKKEYSKFDKKPKLMGALLKKYDEPLGYARAENYLVYLAEYLENGVPNEVDIDALNRKLDKRIDARGYKKWIEGLFDGLIEKEGIRNNKDMFTPSGNRRSWEALHDSVTLENVVKEMRQNLAAGAASMFGANPRGAAQKKYRSLDEIRADKGRLQMLSWEEYDAAMSEALDKLAEATGSIAEHNQRNSYEFFGSFDVGSYVAEILNKTKNKGRIKNALEREYGLNVTDNEMDMLMEAINAIAEVPTGYFEAKPRRAIGFDEVKAAIVPTTLDQKIKDELKERGVNVKEYDPEKEGAQEKAVNDAAEEKDIKFSLKEKVDSKGNTLTPGQQRYFKNSKAVDKNGRLVVVYHSTEEGGFTVFDPEHDSWRGGTKFFFTDSIEMSMSYVSGPLNIFDPYNDDRMENQEDNDLSGTYAVYLNLENPLILDCEGRMFNDLPYAKATDYKGNSVAIGDTFEESAIEDNPDTNTFASIAKKRGYDGVIFRNVKDNGPEMDELETGDVYVAFNSNQVKDIRNENPTDNPDIRYSVKVSTVEDFRRAGHRLTAADEDYINAVNAALAIEASDYLGYMRAMRNIEKMVDRAAHNAGYATKAYHGTDAEAFNEFKLDYVANGRLHGDGFYFSPVEEVAEQYQNNVSESPRGFYLKTNDVDYTDLKDKDLAARENKVFDNIDEAMRFFDYKMQQFERNGQGIDRYRPEADMTDDGMYRITYTTVASFENGFILVATEPEYIKSAEPVTVDENGMLIPLSERFNVQSRDVRFSLNENSRGGQLTPGQQRYFKNSKARDIDGRLAIVYHSTDNGGFTIFDPDFSDDGISLFFTSNRSMSEGYSRNPQGDIDPYNLGLPYPEKTINTIEELKSYLDFLPESVADKIGVTFFDEDQAMYENYPWSDYNFNDYIEKIGDDYDQVSGEIYDEDGYMVENFIGMDEIDAAIRSAIDEINSNRGDATEGQDLHGTYAVYLNLENPLIIDAKGANWDSIKDPGFESLFVSYDGENYYVDGTSTPWKLEELSEFGEGFPEAVRQEVEERPEDFERGDFVYTYYGEAFDPEVEGYPMEGNTRFWCREAMEMGYDGVIFRNLMDNGAYGYGMDEGDVYVAFSSEQVKDIRNENPTEDPDIRYSLREQASITSERLDHLIREYAQPGNKEGDYSQAWIAYIDPRDFLKLTISDEELEKWTEGSENGWGQKVRSLNVEDLKKEIQTPYLKIYSDDGDDVIGHEGRHRMLAMMRAGIQKTPVIVIDMDTKYSKQRMDFINLWPQDYGKGAVNGGEHRVVYDAIPINEKHRAEIEETFARPAEVQFSLRESLEDYDVENAKLREKVDKLRAQMKLSHGTILQDKDSARIARELLDMPGYMGGLRLNDINKQLKNIYALLAKDETMEEGLSEAMELARDIVNHTAEHNDEAEDEFNRLNEYLRTTPIYIDEGHYGDVAGNKAEYNSWRKKMFGKLKIVKMDYPGASSVDNMMMELRELFPGIISDNGSYNEYDQFNQVLAYRDQLERNIDTYFDAEWSWGKEMTTSVASIIFDELEAVQPGKSFADRKKEEKERAVAKVKSKADERIKKLREEKKEAVAKTKEHYREMIKKVREEKNASTEQKLRMRMEREHARNEARKERAYRRRLRESIERDAKQLSEMLLKPTDKKHIPHGYDQAIAALLNSLDFESVYTDAWIRKYGEPSQRVMNLQALREQYQKIMHEGSPNIETSDYMSQLIEALSYKVDGQRLADLNTRTLSEVRTVVKAIKHQIQNINSTFSEGLSKKVSEYGDAIISELSEMEDQKITGGYVGRARDFMMTGNAKPIDFFDRMGSPLQEVFNEIVKGEDAHIRNVKQSIEFIQKVKDQIGGKKPFESWSGEKAKAQVFTLSDGDEIELTPAQIMSLYALNKREQARKHIFASGVVVAPVSRKVKNKLKKKLFGDQLMKTHVHVSYADVVRIVNTLTTEQRMVADKFLGFLNNQCAQWGNETSMKLYGYEAFKESNYFPIKSSEMFLNESTQEKGDAVSKLKNTGFTKSVKDFADNPIVIDDFFRVCTGHINTMSMYNAFVPAITDFERVYNYNNRTGRGIESSVKQMINKKYGNAVNKYISTLLQDLNTQYNKDQEGLTIADELLRRWKSVKIGANARVLVQQPTAITRAQVYIDYKYLAKSLAKNASPKTASKTKERMFNVCPIAYWKHLGFAQTDISREMNDILMGNADSKWNEFAFGMYGFADDVAWTRIFGAVEEETRAKHPEIEEGSAEWKEKVNERFRYIVDRTQVVDSTLHRSQLMRNKGWYMRSLTSFMAEPTTQINMWMTMIKTARDQIQSGDKAAAAKTITRFGQNYLVSMVTLSIAASLISAMRESWTGDDDDEKWKNEPFIEKWLKHYAIDDFMSNINLANQIPWVKDVLSLWQGYDVQRADLSMINDMFDSAKKFKDYFDKDGNVKFSWQKLMADAVADGAALFGVPVGNLKRDFLAGRKMFFNTMKDADYAHFKTDSLELNPAQNKSTFIDYYLNELEKGNDDTAKEIKQFLNENGISQDDIDKTVSRRLNDEVNKAIDDKQPDKMKAIIKKYKKNYNYTSTDVTKKVRRYFSDELKGAIEKGDLDKLDRIVSDQKKYGMAKADIESTVSYWTNRNYKTAIEKGDTKKMDAYDKLLKRSGMSKKDIYMNRGNMYIGYYDMLIYNAGSDKERHRLAREVAHMFPDMTGENYILNFVGNTKSKTNLDNWRQRKWTKAQISRLRYRS